MAVTSGFFNAQNQDRLYNADQMSEIFNGIINDGVFASIGTAFGVKATTGNVINVGIGRAWFNSRWIYNDSILALTAEDSEMILDRIDAVVIEINNDLSVRAGSIKVIKGTPATEPQNPEMASTEYVHQYPLCYILRKAGSTSITQSNITNMIGTSSCPYVTGILQVQDIDNIVAQWQAQWVDFFDDISGDMTDAEVEFKLSFEQWFANLQDQLDENQAGNLQHQIDNIKKLTTVYLDKDNWSEEFPYKQTVEVAGFKENDAPSLTMVIEDNATESEIKEYRKAFGSIYYGNVNETSATIYAVKKPEINFTIGLSGGSGAGAVTLSETGEPTAPVDLTGYLFVNPDEEVDPPTAEDIPYLNADKLGGQPPSFYSKSDNVSDKFSEEKTYKVGDYCIYPEDSTLYKFTDGKEPGAWDETKVEATTVAGELSVLNSSVAVPISSEVGNMSGFAYRMGKFVIFSMYIYLTQSISPQTNTPLITFEGITAAERYDCPIVGTNQVSMASLPKNTNAITNNNKMLNNEDLYFMNGVFVVN